MATSPPAPAASTPHAPGTRPPCALHGRTAVALAALRLTPVIRSRTRAETEVTGLGSKIVKAKSRCPRVAWSLCPVNTIRDLLLAWVTQRLVGSPQSKTLLPPAPRHTHTAPWTEVAAHSPQLSGGRLLSLPGSEGPPVPRGGPCGGGAGRGQSVARTVLSSLPRILAKVWFDRSEGGEAASRIPLTPRPPRIRGLRTRLRSIPAASLATILR